MDNFTSDDAIGHTVVAARITIFSCIVVVLTIFSPFFASAWNRLYDTSDDAPASDVVHCIHLMKLMDEKVLNQGNIRWTFAVALREKVERTEARMRVKEARKKAKDKDEEGTGEWVRRRRISSIGGFVNDYSEPDPEKGLKRS
ncbi:hypothetical protein MMC12_002901 [Toensbergia leucococca]|nr:hypothetical protein [Toensbergia leucococca]